MKIGVELPARFSDAGDYLADARALDAAGVDSIWLSDDGFDPWLVLAGIATVTGRAGLAVPVSTREGAAADALARRMATLHRLSRGRAFGSVALADDLAAAESTIAHLRRAAPTPVLLCASGDGRAIAAARLADGLVASAGLDQCRAELDDARRRREREPFQLWARTAPPQGREHWRRLLKAASEIGATGLLVPADPRLLDLLRNPDEEDDRSDLALAQG